MGKLKEFVFNKKNLGVSIIILGILLPIIIFTFPRGTVFGKSSYGDDDLVKTATLRGGIQEVEISLDYRAYAPIVVQKGVPVKFNIKASEETINGCNGTIIIPELNIQKTLVPGDNIIEFTPEKEGTISYTCWMGMIGSTIEVVSDLKNIDIKSLAIPNSSGYGSSCCNRQP